MTQLEKSCNELRDLGSAIAESAKWYALGDDYCDAEKERQAISKYAHEMADLLVDVFNRIEEDAEDDDFDRRHAYPICDE